MGILDELNELKDSETEVETTEPVEETTEQIEASAEGETAPEPEQLVESEDTDHVEGEPQEYVPDFKYKAMGEEHEMDDWIKDSIKDKETEELARKMFAKARGLDHYAEKHEKLEDTYVNLQTEHESKMKDAIELAKVVQSFNSKIASSDLSERHSAFKDAGIKDDQILDVARHILELKKMPVAQRQAYDQKFQQEKQINQYEERITSHEQKLRNMEVAQAKAQFDSFATSKSDFVKEYEGRENNGNGSFYQDFIDFGSSLQTRLGKELNFDQAFDQFKKVHNLGGKKPMPVKPAPLPNLKSTGHSPISKGFKSLDDLRSFMDKS